LRNSLDTLLGEPRYHFIFACYADKDGTTMLKTLTKPGDCLYFAEPIGLRPFFPNKTLANTAQEIGVSATINSSINDALLQAKAKRKKNEYIVATGSFSVIKAVMENLGWQTVEDGIN
jgi:folylpolyglutamate synthase/dihydropteroate synthase